MNRVTRDTNTSSSARRARADDLIMTAIDFHWLNQVRIAPLQRLLHSSKDTSFTTMMRFWALLIAAALAVASTSAFQPISPRPMTAYSCVRTKTRLLDASTSSSSDEKTTEEENEERPQKVELFLNQKFPSFYSLLKKNDEVFKTLAKSTTGYTLFAPNEQAFDNLGEKKRKQLADVRNEEVVEKMALYHVVSLDKLTATQLRTEDWTGPKPKDGSPRPFTVGGILTMGGEVAVGRSKSGGFLGLGAKEDGDAVIGSNARILKSYTLGDNEGIVHEMDAFISPELLWRYCDQLRIPGF